MAIVAKKTDRNDGIEGAAVLSEELRISQKALDRLFGYEYFIVHRSVDGKDYASALYEALTAKGNKLDCFLDVKHYSARGGLTSMQARALRKTTRLKSSSSHAMHTMLMHPTSVAKWLNSGGFT